MPRGDTIGEPNHSGAPQSLHQTQGDSTRSSTVCTSRRWEGLRRRCCGPRAVRAGNGSNRSVSRPRPLPWPLTDLPPNHAAVPRQIHVPIRSGQLPCHAAAWSCPVLIGHGVAPPGVTPRTQGTPEPPTNSAIPGVVAGRNRCVVGEAWFGTTNPPPRLSESYATGVVQSTIVAPARFCFSQLSRQPASSFDMQWVADRTTFSLLSPVSRQYHRLSVPSKVV